MTGNSTLAIAEPPPDPISEADLSLIWEGQRYPRGALRAGAEVVSAVNPGRRGRGPGPDFRDAVVRLRGEERRGDVELHVRASYFLQHGHHLDPAYDRLVLHVVFLDDSGGGTRLACGESVPVAAFAPWVESRAADIASWPGSQALWREPCHDAVARLGDAGVASVLRTAGAERFRARAAALAGMIAAEGANQALWLALVEALGYGGDREGFRRLPRALPAALLTHLARAFAGQEAAFVAGALLHVAGLRPAPGLAPLLPATMVPALRNLASRPANRPGRRLAAAASMLTAARGELAAEALASVRRAPSAASLVQAWTGLAGGSGAGATRVTELLLNAVLPCVAALDASLAGRCLELAAGLRPNQPYGKTAFLERNLLRSDGRRAVRSALDQQGLLEMHATWCSRGGCGRCPLSP